MKQDNRSNILGLLLIMGILLAWNFFTAPSKEEIFAQKRLRDSIELAKKGITNTQPIVANQPIANNQQDRLIDSSKFKTQSEQLTTLENGVFKIVFSNKGGRIKNVLLKNYQKIYQDSARNDHYAPLYLFEDSKNKFSYNIPVKTGSGSINTEDLYFTAQATENSVTFRTNLGAGFLEQKYTINSGYAIDYDLNIQNLSSELRPDTKAFQLTIDNYLDKIEKNVNYERSQGSQNWYCEVGETPDNQSPTKTEGKLFSKKPINWISQDNQFFNTTIVSKDGGFPSAYLGTQVYTDADPNLKKLTAQIEVPITADASSKKMMLYIGPNDYSILKKYNNQMEDIVNYGGSFLGTINRWIIRPIFDFLHSFIGNVAICILILTLIVKALLYPLNYRMQRTQAKTAALKPEIEKLKLKIKDDPQRLQMETMKLYQEFGANPLGGCLPSLVQMPIWMALFRFFPASIDFRQKGFLWANDLSGFEEGIKLSFYMPLFGYHISVFAVLWGLSLIGFTYYTMKDMDMSGQPAGMKYIQYFMPMIFMVSFNSYAAGLSLYMLFSNLLQIGQTVVTKNYVINHDKIRIELEANKKKPKKTSKFREMMENAQRMQQEATKKKS